MEGGDQAFRRDAEKNPRDAGATRDAGCRWIIIGVLRLGHFARGCPNLLHVTWRGRVPLYQPCEFRRWEQVQEAIRRRLHRARLELVAIACDIKRACVGFGSICNPEGKWNVMVRVLVRRVRGQVSGEKNLEFCYE